MPMTDRNPSSAVGSSLPARRPKNSPHRLDSRGTVGKDEAMSSGRRRALAERRAVRYLRALSERARWSLLAVVAVLTLALGMLGFASGGGGAGRGVTDLLYLAMQLFVLESGAVQPPVPWTLDVARLVAPLVTAFATAGLLTRLVTELRAAAGYGARRRRDHIIICGLGNKGKRLARDFAELGDKVVAVEAGTRERADRTTVLRGDATDPEMLKRAGIAGAKRLIAVCGQDGQNAQIAAVAGRLVAKGNRAEPLSAYIHIADRDLKRLLRPLESRTSREDDTERLRVRLVNIYERGAESMLAMTPSFYAEHRGEMIIVGLGEVGECLVVKASRDYGGPEPLRTCIIDRDADGKVAELEDRHSNVAWDLVPVEIDVTKHGFERGDYLGVLRDPTHVGSIYVCIDDDPLALKTALSMRDRFKEQGSKPKIKVRTSHGTEGLASVLGSGSGREFEGIHAFPFLDTVCTTRVFTAIEPGASPDPDEAPRADVEKADHQSDCSPEVPSVPRVGGEGA